LDVGGWAGVGEFVVRSMMEVLMGDGEGEGEQMVQTLGDL
jgi:hypothetical protein